MKVLLIGSGGREHAIAHKLQQDALRSGDVGSLVLFAAPGNPGIEEFATLVPIGAEDVAALLAFARQESIDLTIVGPEVPLALGIVDRFQASGLQIFGPSAEAAQLESSKAFAKAFMAAAGVPTPAYREFAAVSEALAYVETLTPPIVVKADGLAAGKGVTVAATVAEAAEAVRIAMQDKTFGAAGDRIIIEQFVAGSELSVMGFIDQSGFALMPAIQDHKQVFDGDQGPNTGGMGTFFPVPVAADDVMEKIREQVFANVTRHMRSAGITYRGVLFAGIMVADGQPYVIEFNARFGDPETQVALELLETDLLTVIDAVLEDRVATLPLAWSADPTVCVVLTSQGYPGSYLKDVRINGLAEVSALRAQSSSCAYVLHAGTGRDGEGRVVSTGGRVLNVIGRGPTLTAARESAYTGAERVHFVGKHYRKDIGARPQ